MKRISQSYFLIATVSLLLSCSSEQENRLSAKPITEQKSVLKTATSKTSAPISMQYKVLTQSPAVGQEIEIEVSFQSRVKSSINSKMTIAKKLLWVNDNTTWQSGFNKLNQREALPLLKVIASEEGRFYIHLIASIEVNGKLLSKPFIIAVNVGNAALKLAPAGEIMTDEKGQKIIIQKAETN